MVRVSSPAKLRPWSELIAKMVMGVVPGLAILELKRKPENLETNLSKKGSTPTPWARGLRDQIQKWALQTQKTLDF